MATNEPNADLTAEQVRSLFDYNRHTGILTWRWRDDVPRGINGRDAGRPAGFVHRKTTGHMKVRINGRQYPVHRIIWLHVTGSWPPPKMHVDHIDCDPTNNRFSNLRLATPTQNCQNQRKVYNVSLKGARFHKQSGRWQASIRANGKSYYLGLFDTPELAHAAYCEAAARLHGDFARTG